MLEMDYNNFLELINDCIIDNDNEMVQDQESSENTEFPDLTDFDVFGDFEKINLNMGKGSSEYIESMGLPKIIKKKLSVKAAEATGFGS